MNQIHSATVERSGPLDLYEQAVAAHGTALGRLAQSYEADPDKRQDLLQEIHLALWRSLGVFDGRCSLRTWTYRVAHNVAASHVIRDRGYNARLFVGLESLEFTPHSAASDESSERDVRVEDLLALVQRLKPLDRELMLLYLEGMDAVAMGEITGLSPGNVATKVHRIKKILAARVRAGDANVR